MTRCGHTLSPDAGGLCVLDSHELRAGALSQSALEENKGLNVMKSYEDLPMLSHLHLCLLNSH